MQPLTRDRLAANAYRTLGLSASAGQAAIEAAARRMRIWADPARVPPTPWDLPQLGPLSRSRSDVEHAVARLVDPASRLEDRLLWYHGPAVTAANTPSADVPAMGPRQTPPPQSSVADPHDRAVAALHAASMTPAGTCDAGLWRRAVTEFNALSESPGYLDWLAGKEAEGDFEKRASIEEIAAAVRALPAAVLAAVVPHARAALDGDDLPGCSALLDLLRAGARSPETSAPLRGLLDALEDALDAHCRQMDADLRDKLRTNRTAPEPYYPANLGASMDAAVFYLDNIVPALARIQVVAADDPVRLSRAKSRCADVLTLLALGYEWAGWFVQAERTLLQALDLAGGAGQAEIQKSLDRVRPLAAEERRALHGTEVPASEASGGFDGGSPAARAGNARIRVHAPASQAGTASTQPNAESRRRPRDPTSFGRLLAVSIILGIAAAVILSLMLPSGKSNRSGYNPSPPETSAESTPSDATASGAPGDDSGLPPPDPAVGAGANDVGEVNREP
jgi:hypothetical protein